MSKVKTVEVYLKEKIKPETMNVNFTKGEEYGIENTEFNFSAELCKDPYGDVCFKTSYDNNEDYTSTFIMTAEEAMSLGKILIDTAYKAMDSKRILLEAEACDTRLSFLVLKGLITSIRIERSNEKLLNYDNPYYKYIISAYKDNQKVYSYAAVYNFSYFVKKSEIDYWKDKLTDKGKVKLYFDNWNPYNELEERAKIYQDKLLEALSKNKNLKPIPIKN